MITKENSNYARERYLAHIDSEIKKYDVAIDRSEKIIRGLFYTILGAFATFLLVLISAAFKLLIVYGATML